MMDDLIKDLIELREEHKNGRSLQFFLRKVSENKDNKSWQQLLRWQKERDDRVVERIEENLTILLKHKNNERI